MPTISMFMGFSSRSFLKKVNVIIFPTFTFDILARRHQLQLKTEEYWPVPFHRSS